MEKKIVVVDDSSTIRISLEMALKNLEAKVVQAENGKDALEKINSIKESGSEVSLCFSDVNMPVMNGIDFIKEFRKIDQFTPVVMLTTESGGDIVKEGKEAGATGWIVKPFKPEEIINIAKRFIG